jgi:hypothetical protein
VKLHTPNQNGHFMIDSSYPNSLGVNSASFVFCFLHQVHNKVHKPIAEESSGTESNPYATNSTVFIVPEQAPTSFSEVNLILAFRYLFLSSTR